MGNKLEEYCAQIQIQAQTIEDLQSDIKQNHSRLNEFNIDYLKIKGLMNESLGVESQLRKVIEEKDKQIGHLNSRIGLLEQKQKEQQFPE